MRAGRRERQARKRHRRASIWGSNMGSLKVGHCHFCRELRRLIRVAEPEKIAKGVDVTHITTSAHLP